MTSIRDTCSRTIWLNKGELMMDGPTEEVVTAYEESRSGGGVRPAPPIPPDAVPESTPVAIPPVAGSPEPTLPPGGVSL